MIAAYLHPKLRVALPIIAGILVFDQITKSIVMFTMFKGQVIEVLSVFNLVLVFNYGVSFGMFQSQGMLGFWLLITIALALCIYLSVMIYHSHDSVEQKALSLIIGGAIGNVLDRFIYGGVVDFLDFHLKNRHWPSFNIADCAIVIGAGLIFCNLLWHSFNKPGQHRPKKSGVKKTASRAKRKR
jgi:signal peptidase II